jgi:hypothetical protein
MKNIEIKINLSESSEIKTIDQVLKALDKMFNEPMNYRTVVINSSIVLEDLKAAIAKKDDENISIIQGTTEGCYGMRTGKSQEGITLWCNPILLVERYVEVESDGTKTEYVNPYHLLHDHAEQLDSDDLDGEKFDLWLEALGLDAKSDNTYNHGHNSEDASLMFDFQFSYIELKDNTVLASIMFHCGGDPRGNYTSKHMFKFESIDDLYSVIFPTKCLLDQDCEA